MSIQQDLIATRALIADAGSWLQDDLAQDTDGNSVWPTDKSAVRWSVVGALMNVTGLANVEMSQRESENRYRSAAAFLDIDFGAGDNPGSPYEDFAHFNDANSHDIVLSWLDAKIADAHEPELEPA